MARSITRRARGAILAVVAPSLCLSWVAAASAPIGAVAGAACRLTLPRPDGPYVVGTIIDRVIRTDRRSASFPAGRPLDIQYWYPGARPAATDSGTPYLAEPGLAEALLTQQYYGVDSTTLGAWRCLRTGAVAGAPVVPGSHPLLTFSVGLGVIRANYTTLAIELASRGYLVALVESPLAGLMIDANGGIVSDTTDSTNTASVHRQRVADWAEDVSFALDRLRQAAAPGTAMLARVTDWRRVGALGHSSGGLVAFEVCQRDRRVRACANLDGGFVTPANEPLAPFVTTGLDKPVLVLRSHPLYSDADLAKRGLTRAQWEARGGPGRTTLDSVAGRSRASIVEAFIAGTGHMTFSDAPYVMPSTITRFGGTIIAADRGLLIIATLLDQFFAARFGTATTAPAGATFPEVEFRTLH